MKARHSFQPWFHAVVALLLILTLEANGQTLGEALEQPAWNWTTSSTYPFREQSAITHDGIDAVACQVPHMAPVQGWIETYVEGPAAVWFWWKVSIRGHAAVTAGQAAQIRVDDQVDWERRAIAVPGGRHAIRWTASEDYVGGQALSNTIWLDEVSLGPATTTLFIQPPRSQNVPAGENARLSTEIEGPEPRTIQWLRDGLLIPGATNLDLAFTNVQASHTADYALWTSNHFGVAVSEVARLSVLPIAPVLTTNPVSQRAVLGGSVTFRAAAKGTDPIGWIWLREGVPIAGANLSSLTISNILLADAGNYVAVATNAVGATPSGPAELRIERAPEFTQPPLSQGGVPGATLVLSAEVIASAPPTWQWYFNDTPLVGETNQALAIRNLDDSKLGSYRVAATNEYGGALSEAAVVGSSQLIGWGERSQRFGPAVPALHGIIDISGGAYYRLALQADGSIHLWGDTRGYESSQPPSAPDVIDVLAARMASLALREDGTVLQWGAAGLRPVPAEATQVVALAQGITGFSCFVIRADGTGVSWEPSGPQSVPGVATNLIRVAEGIGRSLYLRADGRVFYLDNVATLSIVATNAVAVASGGLHHLILRADGTVQHLGDKSWGQSNIPAAATNIVAIACGGSHDLALREDGTVLAWGSNPDGECDVPAWATNVVAIEGTGWGSLGLRGEGPPRITSHPMSRSAMVGGTFRFLSSAIGAPPVRLQWLRNGAPISGQTRPWLILTNVQPADSTASYSLLASNALGTATSRVAVIRSVIPSPPFLLLSHRPILAYAGQTVVIQGDMGGAEPMTWQWRRNGSSISDGARLTGTRTSILTVRNIQTSDAGNYTVTAQNASGAATSDTIRIYVDSALKGIAAGLDQPALTWTTSTGTPAIWSFATVEHHDGYDAVEGASSDGGSTFVSTYSGGSPAVSFWWRASTETNADWLTFTAAGVEQARISGETDWRYRSFALPPANVAVRWTFIKDATGAAGRDRVWLDEVVFGPGTPPSLNRQRTSQTVIAGTPLVLDLEAMGTEPFTVRWSLNGNVLGAQTNSTLRIASAQAADAGAYVLVVSNAFGTVTSAAVQVDIRPNRLTVTRRAADQLEIEWDAGLLETADQVEGPWSTLPNALSPLRIAPDSRARFYRAKP